MGKTHTQKKNSWSWWYNQKFLAVCLLISRKYLSLAMWTFQNLWVCYSLTNIYFFNKILNPTLNVEFCIAMGHTKGVKQGPGGHCWWWACGSDSGSLLLNKDCLPTMIRVRNSRMQQKRTVRNVLLGLRMLDILCCCDLGASFLWRLISEVICPVWATSTYKC